MGIAQEVFHSVKTRSFFAGALQLDLNKAFDRVSWGFLKLILIQIGLPYRDMKWIMGCITSVSYTVLVNGFPIDFFVVERGLR